MKIAMRHTKQLHRLICIFVAHTLIYNSDVLVHQLLIFFFVLDKNPMPGPYAVQ